MKWRLPRQIVVGIIVSLAVAGLGLAAEAEKFPDARMQARYDQLITELRCLVCQSGSIAESNALLASDLRREVRDMILAGSSDDEIRRFMTERYGDFVLYRPPLAPRTWLLWFSPVLLLGIGAFVAYRVISQRARLTDTDPDDPAGGERT